MLMNEPEKAIIDYNEAIVSGIPMSNEDQTVKM